MWGEPERAPHKRDGCSQSIIGASLSESHSSEKHRENFVCACVCHSGPHYLFAFLTLTILTFDFDAYASCVADIILGVF